MNSLKKENCYTKSLNTSYENAIDSAQKQLQFRYGKTDHIKYKGEYKQAFSRKSWVGRKAMALPCAVYSGVIKSTYHLVKTFMFGVPAACLKKPQHFKARLFIVARDFQEAWGRVSCLVNDRYGLRHIQESQFHKKCYTSALFSSPTNKIHVTPSPKQSKTATSLQLIENAIAKRKDRRKNNPYVFANKIEVCKSRDPGLLYVRQSPFSTALISNDKQKLSTYLADPHFDLLNHNNISFIEKANRCNYCINISPLIYAIRFEQFDVFQQILAHPNLDLQSEYNSQALIEACQLGQQGERYISALIEKKVNPLFEIHYPQENKPTIKMKAVDFAKKSGVTGDTLNQLEQWTQRTLDGVMTLSSIIEEVSKKPQDESLVSHLQDNISELVDNGMCLNIQSFPLLNCVTTLFCNEQLPASVASSILKKLLENGANPNMVDVQNSTPLMIALAQRKNGWEELALVLFDYRANPNFKNRLGVSPLDFLLTLPDEHRVKQKMFSVNPITSKEYRNRKNLETLLKIHTGGENFPEIIYSLLENLFNKFLENETDIHVHQLLEEAKRSISLAKRLANEEDIDKLYSDVMAADFPVLISSGWSGHATSVVLDRKNQRVILINRGDRPSGEKAGIKVFHYTKELDKDTFIHLLNRFADNHDKNFTKYSYLRELKKRLGLQLINEIELKDQTVSNCTWSSSASPGLHMILEILSQKDLPQDAELRLSPEISELMKKFNQFSRSRLILDEIEFLDQNLETMTLDPDQVLLTNIVKSLLNKITKGKDIYGLYKKSLDAITFSGIRLKDYMLSESQKQAYGQLYGLSATKMEELLLGDKIGDWTLSL